MRVGADSGVFPVTVEGEGHFHEAAAYAGDAYEFHPDFYPDNGTDNEDGWQQVRTLVYQSLGFGPCITGDVITVNLEFCQDSRHLLAGG